MRFSFLVALAAASVAGCAAYYSVFGLSQLFAGASLAVIIMASSLEFSKVIAVSFLHKYWTKISNALKLYLSVGVFILICITSAGIYGFLSNAYQKTAHKLELSQSQTQLLDSKKGLFEKNINDNNNIISTKTKRIEQLTNLRTNQESRLDAATNNGNRTRARTDINSSNQEIQALNSEINALNKSNSSLSDSVNFYSNKLIDLKSTDSVSSEIGPLKYLSQLTGYPMDKVVNWFILLLIFVFDPLAVALVIATNRVIELERGQNNEVKEIREPRRRKGIKIFSSIKDKLNTVKEKAKESFKKKETPVTTEVKVDIVEKPKMEPQEQQVVESTVHNTNRGFSMNIPEPKKTIIEKIGTNKFFKDGDKNKVFFKKR
jgi:hypothetical protein